MNTKADWNAAANDFMAAERERLGGPPSPEEVAAFLNGELSEADAARIRALLVYYPELTSLLTEPGPPSGAGILTAEEIAHDRAALLARVAPPAVPFRRRSAATWLLAAAATVVLVISAGLALQVRRLTQELNTPQLIAQHELHPKLFVRGPKPPRPNYLTANEQGTVLTFAGLEKSPRYRIDLLEGTTRRWTVTAAGGDEVQLSLPRGLPAGTYRIDVYGTDEETPLDSYDLLVTKAAPR